MLSRSRKKPKFKIKAMLKLEVIGNLGADAVVQDYEGQRFTTFRVAHSRKYKNREQQDIEETIWVSCTMNGDNPNLFPYLTRGVKVFVRGNASLKVYVSSLDGQKHAGLNLRVQELELCGGGKKQEDDKPF